MAPLVAPWRLRPSAVGSTPHEHSGSGTPKVDAHRTDFTLPVPKKRISVLPGSSTAIMPAMRKPNSRKTDASLRIFQVSRST